MYFELELVRQGLISAEQLVAAIERQMQSRPPLGRLAIEHRKMTMTQVFETLREQVNSPRPFGRLAVDLGFLSNEELAVLLMAQRDRETPLSDILVESGAICQEQLAAVQSSDPRRVAAASGAVAAEMVCRWSFPASGKSTPYRCLTPSDIVDNLSLHRRVLHGWVNRRFVRAYGEQRAGTRHVGRDALSSDSTAEHRNRVISVAGDQLTGFSMPGNGSTV